MTNYYILDTNVLIGLYRSRKKAVNFLSGIDSAAFATTIFSYAEFVAGTPIYRKAEAHKFLSFIPIVNFDDKSHKVTEKLCRQVMLPKNHLADFFIASVCIANNYELITANAKDFSKFKSLKVKAIPQSLFDF